MSEYIDIVFDGPPSHQSGRFVEVENDKGQSIKFGEWVHRSDGYWALRIRAYDVGTVEVMVMTSNRDRFQKGVHVKPSAFGLTNFPSLRGKTGVVVSKYPVSQVVTVQWEHLKTGDRLHIDFLEVAS